MKRYIKSTKYENNGNIQEYNIEVCYSVELDLDIAASTYSSIKPVRLPNGETDQQALADYNAFADNVYEILCYYFDIVDINFSDSSDTSRYFYMYAKDKDGNLATKFIIRLRLSDHDYGPEHDTKKEHEHITKRSQELKKPSSKKTQRWKFRNIIVNDKTCFSYIDAEDEIESRMESLQKHLLKKKK